MPKENLHPSSRTQFPYALVPHISLADSTVKQLYQDPISRSANERSVSHMLFQLHNDTLNRCLDVEGVYLCKSFSPRSYIIQKVQTRFGHQPNFTLFTFSWFKAINYSLKGNNKSQKKSTTHVASGAPEMQEYPRCLMCFALKSRPGHCG